MGANKGGNHSRRIIQDQKAAAARQSKNSMPARQRGPYEEEKESPDRFSNTEMQDDRYTSVSDTHMTLNMAAKARREIEKDVLLLHNRIKMLQLEENRALKKIEETRKKAKQIQQLRAENDRKFQLKVKEKASHSK